MHIRIYTPTGKSFPYITILQRRKHKFHITVKYIHLTFSKRITQTRKVKWLLTKIKEQYDE